MPSNDSRTLMRRSRMFAIVSILALLVALSLYACGARINRTNSLPKGIYWVVNKRPERGDIVTFWPTDCAEMRMARDRGYIFPGVYSRVNGVGYCLLMKRFLGIPGDVVSVTDEGVYINGVPIQNTKPLESDTIGDPLPRLRIQNYQLKENEAFFISDHMPLSFDARYFGVQKTSQIVEVLKPFIIW